MELLKDIQIKYPLVSAETIQSVYEVIRYPKVVDDLLRLGFTHRNDKDVEHFNKIMKEPNRRQQNYCSDLPGFSEDFSNGNKDNFWSPSLIKHFMWKYYAKREDQNQT